jgi:hypothetical protein
MSDEVHAHYAHGLELYGAKNYAGAIKELEAGYALDPRREFLFAEAQAHRLNGDCKSAVPLYKKFLDSDPEDVQINAAHIALSRCAEQMATAPSPRAATAPDLAAKSTTPVPRAPPRPWYEDVAGGALLGAGVAALALGTTFTVAALSARDDANQSSATLPDYQARWSTARGRSQIAVGAFAAGAALTGAAIYRYLHVRRHRLEGWASTSAASGLLAGVAGRF